MRRVRVFFLGRFGRELSFTFGVVLEDLTIWAMEVHTIQTRILGRLFLLTARLHHGRDLWQRGRVPEC